MTSAKAANIGFMRDLLFVLGSLPRRGIRQRREALCGQLTHCKVRDISKLQSI
jgi:hypothetical protein